MTFNSKQQYLWLDINFHCVWHTAFGSHLHNHSLFKLTLSFLFFFFLVRNWYWTLWKDYVWSYGRYLLFIVSFAGKETLRCLALALKRMPTGQQALSLDDENDLTFIGLVCSLFYVTNFSSLLLKKILIIRICALSVPCFSALVLSFDFRCGGFYLPLKTKNFFLIQTLEKVRMQNKIYLAITKCMK